MKKAFEENIDIKVSSAQIGISKFNWDHAEENWSVEQVKNKMQNSSYDILPIKNKNEKFDYYWSTIEYGNYAEIKKLKISESDKIYYLTELSDLLSKFEESNNRSYFLTNHSEINGLVSNVNLNSKPVYVYFYSLISKVEIELGNWLKELVSEKEMLSLIRDKANNPNDKLSTEALERYKTDKKVNKDNHFVEYLYFSQFQYIIKKKQLTSILGYKSNTKFEDDFKIVNGYRNWFAHPLNSSKINLSEDLFKLDKALKRIIENLESL